MTPERILLSVGKEGHLGGFIPGHHGVDSIIVGCYRGKVLVYGRALLKSSQIQC